MYNTHAQKDFFLGAFVGSIATLTVLLFTTKRGKEIQRQIGDLYEGIEGSVKETLSESKDKLEEMGDHLSKKFNSKSKHEDQAKDLK